MPSGTGRDAFACRAFAGDPTTSVGVSPAEFAVYLRFLAKLAGDVHCEANDTIAALVFHRDSCNRLRCWIEPDLLSVGRAVEARYIQLEKLAEAKRLAVLEAHERSVRPKRSGPSLG